MWLIVSFDVPSEQAKEYRKLRKGLLKYGFTFFQRSFCWRYADCAEKMESLCARISDLAPPGSLLLLPVTDRGFSSGTFLLDRCRQPMPSPPQPWKIV